MALTKGKRAEIESEIKSLELMKGDKYEIRNHLDKENHQKKLDDKIEKLKEMLK